MTKDDIRKLALQADPNAAHYEAPEAVERGLDHTVWQELRRLPFYADDEWQDAWKFFIHRFTKNEYDPIAQALIDVLDAQDDVAYGYDVDYEPDTGYIHHIFDCEGF